MSRARATPATMTPLCRTSLVAVPARPQIVIRLTDLLFSTRSTQAPVLRHGNLAPVASALGSGRRRALSSRARC